MEPIDLVIAGAGGRAQTVMGNLLKTAGDGVRVVAVYDPDADAREHALSKWNAPNAVRAATWEDAVRVPGARWAMVFSPNARHRDQILAAFDAGLHVFAEKPLATTFEDCRTLYEASKAHPELIFATGFVLRYAPIYRRVKTLLADGSFGKILGIDANENIAPAHGGYITGGWRQHLDLSGPHLLEKCCHDLDLLAWFAESLPARVASFGGRGMFTPENAGLLDRYGSAMFQSWYDPNRSPSPFTAKQDLMDNQVCILEYRNGVRVQFQATMSNPIPERRMYISCTEGTIRVEMYAGTLEYRRMGDECATRLDFKNDFHGGGDTVLMREMFETMKTGATPACGALEGMESAIVALALDEAARTGTIVDLGARWAQVGR